MSCQSTQDATPEKIDIAALRERYRQERDKRIIHAATDQYERSTGDFAQVYEGDPHMPIEPRAAIDEDLDVAILGAGWTGILAAYHLKQAGVTAFRHIDHAGDFGGVYCMIFASGFEVTSDLDRRWGIDVIEGRGGSSLYKHWADGYKTLHGMMTRGFPNQFFTGFIQSALNASTTEQMSRHGYHIAYVIKEALARRATVVEPTEAAQSAWVRHVHETAIDISQFTRECTPSYFNGEGSEKPRWYAGETYGPGWMAFEQLLHDWRNKGDMAGLVLTVEGG
jgi:hypothetical protein